MSINQLQKHHLFRSMTLNNIFHGKSKTIFIQFISILWSVYSRYCHCLSLSFSLAKAKNISIQRLWGNVSYQHNYLIEKSLGKYCVLNSITPLKLIPQFVISFLFFYVKSYCLGKTFDVWFVMEGRGIEGY
jgi:hypothetical protein